MRISDWSSDVCSSDLAKPLLIPYGRLAGHLPSISAGTVLAGEVPQELLQGRIIVVGATASGLASRYSMSMGTVMPGIKIQAHILQGLLDKQMIDRKSVVSGKSVSVRVDLGGRRIIKKKTPTYIQCQ